MEDQNFQLEELVTKAAANHRRAFRRSMIFSVFALLAGGIWLFYSFNEVKTLEVRSSELRREIDAKAGELSAKEKQLQEAKAALLAINPLLGQTYVSQRIGDADIRSKDAARHALRKSSVEWL